MYPGFIAFYLIPLTLSLSPQGRGDSFVSEINVFILDSYIYKDKIEKKR